MFNEISNTLPAAGMATAGIGVVMYVARLLLKVQSDVSRRYDTQVSRFRAEVVSMRSELEEVRAEDRRKARRISALEAEVVRLGGNPDQLNGTT